MNSLYELSRVVRFIDQRRMVVSRDLEEQK